MKAAKVRAPSSALVLAPGVRTHPSQPRSQAPRAAASHPLPAGERRRSQLPEKVGASPPSQRPASPGPGRVRTASQELPQRRPRTGTPPALRSRHSPSGGAGSQAVPQTTTYTHLQNHGWNKQVALETATAGAGASSLECLSESADNNALTFEDSRRLKNHARFFPFMSSARPSLRVRCLPLYACALFPCRAAPWEM